MVGEDLHTENQGGGLEKEIGMGERRNAPLRSNYAAIACQHSKTLENKWQEASGVIGEGGFTHRKSMRRLQKKGNCNKQEKAQEEIIAAREIMFTLSFVHSFPWKMQVKHCKL